MSRRPSSLIVIIAISGLLACAQPTTLSIRDRAVIEQTLEDQLRTWARAWNNEARDTLSGLYVQDSTLTVVWVDGRVSRGWQNEEMAQSELYNSTDRINVVLQNPWVQILSPTVAVATFSHSIDVVRVGGRRDPVRPGSGTLIWVRDLDDNVWRIQTAHLSVVPPAMN